MSAKKFAYVGGIIMLIMGVTSLIPGLVGNHDSLPLLKVQASYGLFLGIFPMNILNKLALMIFGISGIAASKRNNLDYSINYSRIVFFAMGLFSLLGIFPATNTLGGYWPLFGNEALAHGAFALMGGYCGFLLHKSHHQSIHAGHLR
jgi:hypothetical protein